MIPTPRRAHPSVPGATIIGDYANRLDNTGEWITLQAADGTIIDRFRYNDIAPWPIAADGSGSSLVMIDPPSDPGLGPGPASNWPTSPAAGGSPGGSGT